jgi:hypothetical protein
MLRTATAVRRVTRVVVEQRARPEREPQPELESDVALAEPSWRGDDEDGGRPKDTGNQPVIGGRRFLQFGDRRERSERIRAGQRFGVEVSELVGTEREDVHAARSTSRRTFSASSMSISSMARTIGRPAM